MAADLSTIHKLRQEYKKAELRENKINPDALKQFQLWFNEALEGQLIEPAAMTLATSDTGGFPSARIVLLKKVDEHGFTFFTNYESRKAHEIEKNPQVSLLFFWPQLERQVRVMGRASKISFSESEKYFHSRPFESQLGALASPQSEEIENRETLDNKLADLRSLYKDKSVPMPIYWGGYLVKPEKIEFWQGRPNRLHDRILYTRNGHDWRITRLAP